MTKKKEQKSGWGGRRDNQTGRPKGTGKPIKASQDKAVTVSLSMPGKLHAALAARAEAEGKSVNDVVREAITAWVHPNQ